MKHSKPTGKTAKAGRPAPATSGRRCALALVAIVAAALALRIVGVWSEVFTEGGVSLHTFLTYTDDDCPVGQESWYYLRVILEDNNMAWSSPMATALPPSAMI